MVAVAMGFASIDTAAADRMESFLSAVSVLDPQPCEAGTTPEPGTHWIGCETEMEGQLTPGGPPSTEPISTSPGSGVSYSYMWVPTCPGALPGDGNVGELDCPAAHSCADPQLMSMSLYAMQLTNPAGQPIQRGWVYLGSECRDPQDAGPTRQPRVLTWSDVLSAIRQVGVPGASVEAPDYTLVNLESTFYTEPTTVERDLVIIGYDVQVRAEPSAYTWHWGDGSSQTTDTPGHPYPSKDITHTYVRATPPNAALRLSVDVTYTAQYRVDGGDWQQIPETLTITGPGTDLPIKQASAVLVAED